MPSHRTPTVFLLPVLLAGGACAGIASAQQATFEFTDSGQALGNSASLSVALGDLDGDGDLDAMVANGNAQSNTVWTNDGNGTFTRSEQTLGNSFSRSVALGDLDGDGDLDVMVANDGQPNTVWTNDGNGNFTNSEQALGINESQAIALGDLDDDGDLDAMVANGGTFGAGIPNTVWTNDGNGNFTNSGQELGNSGSRSVALGDLDGDGDIDAMFANNSFTDPNTLWINNGTGTFTKSEQALGVRWSAVALGDLDGDGDLDAMAAVFGSNAVWINDGEGNFTNSGQALGNSDSIMVALGDLNGDGDLDAMFANYNSQPNTAWANDGNGTFTDSGQDLGNSRSQSVALGDLDGDGDLDAMVGNSAFSGGQPNTVWFNTIQGACCVKDTCVQMQAGNCADIGGTYLGGNCSDTICQEPTATGACCVTSGCTIISETVCTELGGSWTESGSCDDCPTICPADLNGDGTVDGQDLAAVLAAWGLLCDE